MAKIVWTEEAVRWMKDIHDYIILDNPDAAQRVVSGIYQKIQILKDFPEIGYIYRHEKDGEIRILLYGHYRIAYLVKNETAVIILGIFHSALDIDRYFL